MGLKFYTIGDKETVLGFNLVGVPGQIVSTPEEAVQALDDAFRTEGLGIIILSERIAHAIRGHVDRYLYNTSFPLIIEIPDREGPMEGRGTVRDQIRAAVGVHF